MALGRMTSFLLLHPLHFLRTCSFSIISLAPHCPGEFEHLLVGFLPMFSQKIDSAPTTSNSLDQVATASSLWESSGVCLLVVSLQHASQTSVCIHIAWGFVRRQVLMGRSGPSLSLYFSGASEEGLLLIPISGHALHKKGVEDLVLSVFLSPSLPCFPLSLPPFLSPTLFACLLVFFCILCLVLRAVI